MVPGVTSANPDAVPKVVPSAREDVMRGCRILQQFPGTRRVWLFGSLAKGRKPDARSDIDFAVEGLSSMDQLRAWSELDATLRLPPDLVRWETANPTLRSEIERWGILLYEHPAS